MSWSHRACVLLLLFAPSLLCVPVAFAADSGDAAWHLSHVNLPDLRGQDRTGDPVVVAVVDDGVNITHQDIAEFIWSNQLEIPDNGVDDDGNGYVDDSGGWDVSDGDPDVTPPDSRRSEYYHGTYLSGIISGIARAVYGDRASDYIKIMPVKSISNDADRLYVLDGYRGIEYAIVAGADIIVTAWGVGQISEEEERILRQARERDIVVVASAGNLPEGREQFPAALQSVLSVAAIDRTDRKIELSNYGQFVDLSAPGAGVVSASAVDTSSYETREGSSVAAAIVAGAAAIARVEFPGYSAPMIGALLKDAAAPIGEANPQYLGQLGAGLLDLGAALEHPLFARLPETVTTTLKPQGYLRIAGAEEPSSIWNISPAGEFSGIRFRLFSSSGEFGLTTLAVYATGAETDRLVGKYQVSNLPETFFVPASVARVEVLRDGLKNSAELVVEYQAEPIDIATRYCRGTTALGVEGTIEDGSGPNPYSPRSDCKWLITAPVGQVIHIRFVEFDTEPVIDKIYLFNGTGTHERIMAVFSGPNIPPEITTWSNQVLVWFVTDGQNQGKGWKAEYQFVDAE